MVAVLIEAIKEQQEQINELKQTVKCQCMDNEELKDLIRRVCISERLDNL